MSIYMFAKIEITVLWEHILILNLYTFYFIFVYNMHIPIWKSVLSFYSVHSVFMLKVKNITKAMVA